MRRKPSLLVMPFLGRESWWWGKDILHWPHETVTHPAFAFTCLLIQIGQGVGRRNWSRAICVQANETWLCLPEACSLRSWSRLLCVLAIIVMGLFRLHSVHLSVILLHWLWPSQGQRPCWICKEATEVQCNKFCNWGCKCLQICSVVKSRSYRVRSHALS